MDARQIELDDAPGMTTGVNTYAAATINAFMCVLPAAASGTKEGLSLGHGDYMTVRTSSWCEPRQGVWRVGGRGEELSAKFGPSTWR